MIFLQYGLCVQLLNISSLAITIAGYTFRKAIKEDISGDILVLQSKNISTDGNIEGSLVQTSLSQALRTAAFLEKNDIVLSARGVFKSAVYTGNTTNVLASSSLFIIRITTDIILPEYLSLYFNSIEGQREFQKITSGSTIPIIKQKDVLGVAVPVPTIEEQKKILSFWENWRQRKFLLEKKTTLHSEIATKTLTHFFSSL